MEGVAHLNATVVLPWVVRGQKRYVLLSGDIGKQVPG